MCWQALREDTEADVGIAIVEKKGENQERKVGLFGQLVI